MYFSKKQLKIIFCQLGYFSKSPFSIFFHFDITFSGTFPSAEDEETSCILCISVSHFVQDIQKLFVTLRSRSKFFKITTNLKGEIRNYAFVVSNLIFLYCKWLRPASKVFSHGFSIENILVYTHTLPWMLINARQKWFLMPL